MDQHHETRIGIAYALAAFLFWGVAPVYFKWIADVPAMEIIAHRILFSALFLAVFLRLRDGAGALTVAFENRRQLALLALSGALVAGNWLVFVWAVSHDRILETSLGYYINPLVNVLLGVMFLHERLRAPQWLAVALAAFGTAWLAIAQGHLPWVSLVLAFSFGFYGLIRKQVVIGAVCGLYVETALLTPIALAYLVYLILGGALTFSFDMPAQSALLIGVGLVTILPLVWFANGARRLSLSTIGIFQYLAPSLSFVIAVMVYDEPFAFDHGVTFGCIWAAIAIYSTDGVRRQRRARIPT